MRVPVASRKGRRGREEAGNAAFTVSGERRGSAPRGAARR